MPGHDGLAALIAQFGARFGHAPAVVARAPGRVNLLGEHTDYNGLPVLPMAIDRSVLVAASPRPDRRVELANVDARFPPRSYELGEAIAPFEAGDWGNYHKAAGQGLVAHFDRNLRGGSFLVSGDVPAGAGLSSSAALVVGSALALLAVNDRELPRLELAELAAASERYVGTLSGGMDQAVCLLAEAGRALRVDFDPLRARPVPLPRGYEFVVCDSLVRAEKSGAARDAYNRRVFECRLACCVLGHALRADLPRPPRTLGEVPRLASGRTLAACLAVLEGILPDRPLSLAELASLAGESPAALASAVGVDPASVELFRPLARARHVVTEAARVDRAERALGAGEAEAFGALMNESHRSCRDDYEISCPELEALVDAATRAGALGARLTGAGFGGCTVSLVASAAVERFIDAIETGLYAARAADGERPRCFRFRPSAGAAVRRAPFA